MLTIKQLRLIAAFIAGRIAAKEVELGDTSFKSENNEQKFLRIEHSLTELIFHLNRHMPDCLPTELRKICAEAKKDIEFDLN